VLKLLLATNNAGKVREYRELLRGLPFQLVSPAEEGIKVEVEETGESYEANAGLKATTLAGKSRLLVLADDSGLEVDALGGEPGVRSARYAGEGASDEARLNYLLGKLVNVPADKRTACFRCVIAIATPGGEVDYCSGECHGHIALEPRGEKGFGYDPVFLPAGKDKTMAELSMAMKNRISHRAKAARKAYRLLQRKYL
jgi:XTP/dITP diphosphohydrolase